MRCLPRNERLCGVSVGKSGRRAGADDSLKGHRYRRGIADSVGTSCSGAVALAGN